MQTIKENILMLPEKQSSEKAKFMSEMMDP